MRNFAGMNINQVLTRN